MFQLTTLFEDALVRIEESPENQYLSLVWLTHPDSARFKNALTKLASIMAGKKVRYLISDSRNVFFLDISSQNFLANEVYPLLIQDEKLFIAYVVSPATFDMMDIYGLSELVKSNPSLKRKLETNFFFNQDDAQDWLHDQKKLSKKQLQP